jgi:TolB-like protein/Tfp pilus assembly protein PilF
MTDAPPERQGPWERLRRRKVVQWGLLYIAGAWGFLQGLEYVGESFHWPDQVRQIALLTLLIGLPIVVVLAWYHGDRGEQRIRGSELGIIALLFLVGGGIFWLYDRGRETDSERSMAQDTATALSPHRALPAPDAKSIAVLPFADMSPQKDQQYMSDGIAEELLNLLAKVPDLKVIARTSSFSFKDKDVEIAEIAKRLNVAHVLEGSVRKSGNTVRITAQLIRTSDSTHLWSERYDRPIDDIFAVQDEIASAIVQALQIRLMGGTLDRQHGGTETLEAYELYLRARNGEDWHTEASLNAAAEHLQKAIDLDPTFSMAWATLASVIGIKAENGYLDADEGFERSRSLTKRALELQPNNAYARAELSAIHLGYDWDWTAAEGESQRALAIDPTDPRVLLQAGRLSATLGRYEDALRQFRAALVRDPLHDYVNYNLAFTHYRMRRFPEAEAAFRKTLEVAPTLPWTRGMLGQTLLMQRKFDAALAVVQEDPDESMRAVELPVVLWAIGRRTESDEALSKQIEHWRDTGAYYVALTYAQRGDHDLAMKWLERAYDQRDLALIEMFGDPVFDSLADDPRFKAFLRKMKLPEWPKHAATNDVVETDT